MSNDKDIRETLKNMAGHIGGLSFARYDFTSEQFDQYLDFVMGEVEDLISTKQIEARIDEAEKHLLETGLSAHSRKLLHERVAELKSQLATERKDDETR